MPSLHHLLIGRLGVTVRTQTQVIMIIAPMRSIGELCHRHHLPFYRQPTDIRGVCDLFFIESSQGLSAVGERRMGSPAAAAGAHRPPHPPARGTTTPPPHHKGTAAR